MTRDDVMRETLAHTRRVGELLVVAIRELQDRALSHDASKFSAEEFESFAEVTPGLKELTYGSEEYRAKLQQIKPAIEIHYQRNRHHPEHHANGIRDMTLVDLIEMLADWRAASERHANGDFLASIEQNAKRFGYDDAMKNLLVLTAGQLGWAESPGKGERDA